MLIGSWGIAHAGPTVTVDKRNVSDRLRAGRGPDQIWHPRRDLDHRAWPDTQRRWLRSAITDNTLGQTWGNGQNGVELAFSFTGFTSTTVIAPTASTPGKVNFSGGTVDFYVLPAGTQISGLGSVAADQAAVQSGTLWLSEKAAVENSTGDTLQATIPAGATLNNFKDAAGFGFLDVTGGPAGPYLATGSFANGFDTGGLSDESLSSDFSSSSTQGSDFGVSGSLSIKANGSPSPQPIPEPFSLAILGVGMLAVGVARRRGR